MAYIKDSVIGCFKKQLCELEHNPDKFSRVKAKFLKNYVIVTLEASKTDDVVEVKHGYWKECGDLAPIDARCKCSLCGGYESNYYTFCHNCGAKMDGGVDE